MKKALLFLAAALVLTASQAQTIFSEDFDGVTLASNGIGTLPSGWTTYADNLTNYSSSQNSLTAFGQSWSVYNYTGSKSAFSITYTVEGTACDRWMVTPQISIPSDGEYYLVYDVLGSAYHEVMDVKVSTTDVDKESFTNIYTNPDVDSFNVTNRISLAAYAGQDVYLAFVVRTADGFYLSIDNIAVKTIPENGIALSNVSAPSNANMNEDFTVNVNVINDGDNPLTSFDIAYSLNGGTTETVNVTGINVAFGETYTYPLVINHPTPEMLTVDVTVSNPNGVADNDDSDNSGSCTLAINDPSAVTARTTLLEHFTTTVCPNCPAGHTRIKQALTGTYAERVIWVAHHCGYYTDAYTISESEALLPMFGGSYTYAPGMMIDRDYDIALMSPMNGEDPDGPAGFPNQPSTIQSQLDAALATPTYVSCRIENLTYDHATRELKFNVNGEFYSTVGGDPRISVYIVEDSIVGSQSGASGRYVHDHVVRAALNGAWGSAEAITSTEAGSTYSQSFTYNIPTTSRDNKCYVVAFINNYSTSIFDRKVLNADKSGMISNVGIDDVETSVSINTYPNPVSDVAYINASSTIRNIEVVNAMGQRVFSQNNINADVFELDVHSLASGMYFLNITTERGTVAERLSVVR